LIKYPSLRRIDHVLAEARLRECIKMFDRREIMRERRRLEVRFGAA